MVAPGKAAGVEGVRALIKPAAMIGGADPRGELMRPWLELPVRVRCGGI